MLLSNIRQFLVKNKRIFYFVTLFFIVSFLFSDTALAWSASIWNDTPTSGAQKAVEIFNWLLKWVSVLLGLMTYLTTLFLSPEWINGSLFWMNTKFKEVWIMVSNLVYFVFAFILIWIAFMNIIWKNADQYQLKQALPKFIVWVIIVPFSWFFVQLILSVSAILTVSALTLPIDSFPDYNNMLKTVEVPNECTIDITMLWNTKDKVSWWDFIKCWAWTVSLNSLMMWGSATNSIYGVLSMYTYWVIWFENVDNISLEDKWVLTQIWDVVVKVVFDFLFVLVYAILIIALWMVLMIRWIYIWIYTMLSPIFWLMYFFDKKDGGWDWFFAKFNVKEFIALAMVPVYTMLALSFWLLFIYLVWSWLSWTSTSTTLWSQTVKVDSKDDEWSITIWEWSNAVTLTIKWAVSSTSKDTTWLVQKIGWWGLWVVWALILKLFGIVVLWWTVMAAMSSSKITGAIIKPLQDFGTKVWWIVSSAPWNMPIFGGQSMKSMGNIAWKTQSYFDSKQVDKAWKFVSKNMKFMDNSSVEKTSKMQNRINKMNNETLSSKQYAEQLRWILKENWNTDSIIWNKTSQEALLTLAKKLDIDTKDFKFWTKDEVAIVVKRIDAKLDGSWSSVITWTNNTDFNWNKLDKFMKNLNNSTNTSNRSGSDSSSSVKVEQNDDWTYNFNFWKKWTVSLNKDTWELTWSDDLKVIARSLISKWLDTSKDKFKDELEKYVIDTFWFDKSTDSEAIKKIVWDIFSKYEENNWKYVFKK